MSDKAKIAKLLLIVAIVMGILAIAMLGMRIAGKSDLPLIIPLFNLAGTVGLTMAALGLQREAKGASNPDDKL